ncbi:MAG TPA: 4'-phosphopantetheinyl transferase superfamily protein [Vicinamibacterales bacterium]|nr:4'-phosphopantetheinyl transferase superfamily protein [Vicinamibacterales bacterium]
MDDEIHITYCLTARLDDAAVRAAVDELSPEERARHDRMMRERDRRDFAVAHAMLRRSLSARGDCAPHEWIFTKGARGKPALMPDAAARTRLSFNLAHTDGLVACAVAQDAEVGIDVEAVDRRADALGLAGRFFSPAEVAELQRCADGTRLLRFIEIWTLKEAYVKALGEGLSCPLREFAFVFDGPQSLRFESGKVSCAAAWQFALFEPSDRHRMAVAVGSRSPGEPRLAVRAYPQHEEEFVHRTMPVRTSVSSMSNPSKPPAEFGRGEAG